MKLQLFKNTEFGELNILTIDGKEYFPATECAEMLGYVNPRQAIIDNCRCVTTGDVPHPQSPSKTISKNFIPEGDLYRLIARSKLPAAEKFEHWVFDEVLPSIRKHGAYMNEDTLEKALTSPDFLIQLATKLKTEQTARIEAETKLTLAQPKVLFADSVAASQQSILIGDMAKIINQSGVDIGAKRLFVWLRENGYLMKSTEAYNMPTQKARELNIIEIKEGTHINPDGSVRLTKTTKITGKGQIYFINKFLNELRLSA